MTKMCRNLNGFRIVSCNSLPVDELDWTLGRAILLGHCRRAANSPLWLPAERLKEVLVKTA